MHAHADDSESELRRAAGLRCDNRLSARRGRTGLADQRRVEPAAGPWGWVYEALRTFRCMTDGSRLDPEPPRMRIPLDWEVRAAAARQWRAWWRILWA